MFRVNAFCFWVFLNIGFILMVESIMDKGGALALNMGDPLQNPIELFSVFMAILATFRITFGTLHVIRMKCQLSSSKFKLKRQNLLKNVQAMQGNLEDSDYLLKDYIAQQEEADQADDDLLATLSPLDMKLKKELAIKAQKEQRKRRAKGPDAAGIMDADNDDIEFSDAEAEELQDVEEHEQGVDLDGSHFMTSYMAPRANAGFGGRNSYREKVLERSHAGAELKRKMSAAAKHHARAAGAPGADGSSQDGPYRRPGKGNQGGQGGDQELVEIKKDKDPSL
jgi:hypothetical protein